MDYPERACTVIDLEIAELQRLRARIGADFTRAVAALPVLCELAIPFVRPGGLFIAWKGAKAEQDEVPQSAAALTELGVELHYLVTWRDILGVARGSGYFQAAILDKVEAFLDAPLPWSEAHGGVADLPPKP